jgi:type VI secretion system secreted protein Hcp
MAMDMFIKIGTVKGESLDKTHVGDIDVLAWSWGASNSGNAHIGGGAGAGKVNVQDLSFTKYVDKSTPSLFAAVCDGSHFADATLVVRKAGKTPIEYITIKMTEVFVTSISAGGSGGEDKLTENVTLNFAKFNYSYKPQKADGTADTAVPMGWDIQKNVKA